jgi:signal transduction histidine kinase
LKLHKEDTHLFEPFVDTLMGRSTGRQPKQAQPAVQLPMPQTNLSEKYLNYFQSLYSFEKRIQQYTTIQQVLNSFNNTICKFVDSRDTALFFFNEEKTKLLPVANYASQETKEFIDRAYKNDLLATAFATGKLTIVQTSRKSIIDNKLENHIIIPIPENKDFRGALTILTTLPSFKDHLLEFQLITIMLRMAVNKIDSLTLKQNLKTTVEELHTYQSKLSNDYKLSAIGELTYGVVEHIFSPLQVIMSSADLLRMSVPESDSEVIDNIKEQIEKVKSIVQPLVKFAQSNNVKQNYEAIYLNDLIEDYFEVVSSSFKQMNYECILDLEEGLPSVLSSTNEVNQFLTSLFTILKSQPQNSGGILVQTKHQNDLIIFKAITTDFLPLLVEFEKNPTRDLSIMILARFINKLEGKITTEASRDNGSTITFVIPLKRKVI